MASAASSSATSNASSSTPSAFGVEVRPNERQKDVRSGNIVAAKAVADTIRTSLGPRGMDKMIYQKGGDVVITNDGATILKQMEVQHPAAKMLVELSKSQDIEAGDGTTSVTVLAGALLGAVEKLLARGIHPMRIAPAFRRAATKAQEVLKDMAQPVDLNNRDDLVKNATTSLNSKLVSQFSSLLAPLAVDAVRKVINLDEANNVDLNDIRVVTRIGGSIEDTELVDGLVFTQKASRASGAPTTVTNAKIGLIQFQLSAPKTNMDNQVVISDYTQMDRVLKQERVYTANLIRQIKKTGCNVLLIQKSILRDAVSDQAADMLSKSKIMFVKDIERDEIEFISKTLGCKPIASIESFVAEKLGSAEVVEEIQTPGGRIVKATGTPGKGTVTVLVRAPNQLMLAEADRSLHDALCVVRSLVKQRFMLPGGGAPEIEIAMQLSHYAKTLAGAESFCVRAYAEAFELIPYTLAENAGLHPIAIVTELRNRHAAGEKNTGINVRKGTISDIVEENVVQPMLVSSSAISLATETVVMILKIDDVVPVR